MPKPKPKPDLSHIEPDLRPIAVPIADLLPDPHQAQEHDGRSVAEIERSLREHGQCKPVVVERATGHVKAGNGTLEAAQRLGWTHLAAVRSDQPEEALRLYALRDNRSAQFARWIGDRVIKELSELDVEPEAVGWTSSELSALEMPDFDEIDESDVRGLDDAPPAKDASVTCPSCGNVFRP